MNKKIKELNDKISNRFVIKDKLRNGRIWIGLVIYICLIDDDGIFQLTRTTFVFDWVIIGVLIYNNCRKKPQLYSNYHNKKMGRFGDSFFCINFFCFLI